MLQNYLIFVQLLDETEKYWHMQQSYNDPTSTKWCLWDPYLEPENFFYMLEIDTCSLENYVCDKL